MSLSSSGSADGPPKKTCVSPVAGEYTGYGLKSARDFPEIDGPYEDVSLSDGSEAGDAERLDDSALGERDADPDMLKDDAGTDGVAAGALGLFLVGFLVAFILACLGASCKLGLCSTTDRSSTVGQSFYEFATFDFSAPVQYLYAALSACFLASAVMSLKAILVIRKDVGTPYMVDMATRIREGSHSFLLTQGVFSGLLAVFIVGPIWGATNWRVALCFIVGVVCSIISGWIGVAIATRGNLRTAAATNESLAGGVATGYNTGAVVSLAMASFGLGGISVCYLFFSDVHALIGFVMGASTVSLVSRFSGGIFAKAADTGTDFAGRIDESMPEDDPRNPGTIADSVGSSIGNVAGVGSDFMGSLAGSIAATAMLGATLPYFEDNSYALCVYNHLLIDMACHSSAPSAPDFRTSIAAAICRQGNKYLEYPELRASQGISLFVALPFLIGMIGVISSALISFRTPGVPSDCEVEEINPGDTFPPSGMLAASKIVRSMHLNTIFASAIVLVGCAITCFTMFGASSKFADGLSGPKPGSQLPRYELDRGSDDKDLCATINLGEDTARTKTPVPDGRFIQSSYQPIDSFGRTLPPADETSWRLFLCAFMGLSLGLAILGITNYFTSYNFAPTRLSAVAGQFGPGAVLAAGVGTGFVSAVLPLLLIVATIIVSDSLYGCYGVGIATVTMLSIVGVTMSATTFGPVAENSKAIAQLASLPAVARHRAHVLDSVGNANVAMGRGYSAAAAILTAYVIITAIINNSGLAPPPRKIVMGQFESTNPIRHISEVEAIALVDSGVISGTLAGILVPFLFTGIVLAALSRSTQTIVDEIRHQFGTVTGLLSGDRSVSPDYSSCVDRAGRNALLESAAPSIIVGLVPLCIGFGLGQRALLGFLLGLIGSGYMLGVFMTTAGGTWENAKKLVESGEFGENNSIGSDWHAAVFAGHAVGASFKDAAGPCMSSLSKVMASIAMIAVPLMQPGASTKWWIGLILLFVSVLTLWVSSKLMGRRRENSKQPMAEDAADVPIRNEIKISPFYSEGPDIRVAGLAPGSMLGREYRALTADEEGREEIGRRGALALPSYKID